MVVFPQNLKRTGVGNEHQLSFDNSASFKTSWFSHIFIIEHIKAFTLVKARKALSSKKFNCGICRY